MVLNTYLSSWDRCRCSIGQIQNLIGKLHTHGARTDHNIVSFNLSRANQPV